MFGGDEGYHHIGLFKAIKILFKKKDESPINDFKKESAAQEV